MKGKRWTLILSISAIVLGMFFVMSWWGCQGGDDDDDDDFQDDDDADDHLDQGKYWLQVGEGDKAREEFLQALGIEPGNPEGLYGMVLADMLHITDVLSIIVDYIKSLEYGGPVKEYGSGDEKVESSRGMVNYMIRTVLEGLLLERAEEMVVYARTTQGIEGVTFELDGIPIIIAFELMAELGTEFDKGELIASESYALIMKALASHLLVINLDFDLSLAFQLAEIDFDELATIEAVSLVVDILYRIMHDPAFPYFLTMYTDGVELYQQAGWELAMGLNAFIFTFGELASETDDQSDDVMGYLDANGNFMWDFGEPWVIPHFDVLDGMAMSRWAIIMGVVESYRNSLLDYTEFDVDPENPNPFRLDTLNPLLESYGIDGFIPEDAVLDLGLWYAFPNPTSIRDTLIELIDLLRGVLPPPPDLD